MQKLTERQRKVLDFIRTSIEDHGYPPTLREIGNFMGIRSTNGVNDHLRALERKGYLTREDMKSRTLRLTPAAANLNGTNGHANGTNGTNGTNGNGNGHHVHTHVFDDLIEVPILGRVAAGQPLEAIQETEGTIKIDRMLVGGSRDVFGLRVRGDSMIDAGIQDGDFVFVRKHLEAKRGDVIVALIGDEATCKYYYPERDHVRLEPANSRFAPILVHRNDWRSTQILGVVVGIYRRLES